MKEKLKNLIKKYLPLPVYISWLRHKQVDFYAELMRKEGVPEEQIMDPKQIKDYFRCFGKYGISVCYYVNSDMYHITDQSIRDSFVGHVRLYGLWFSVNSGPSRRILDNRNEYLARFAKYLNREWLDVKDVDFETFTAFCKKHPKMIAKEKTGFGGKGIHLFESGNLGEKELKETFETYKENGTLIEEYIYQNGMLHDLNPESLNCLRVCTLRYKDHVEVFQCLIKSGCGNVCADNTHQGGVYALVDAATGTVTSDYLDDRWVKREAHPATGMVLKGKQIPHWDKVRELVLKAADEVPDLMYVSWDVAVSGDGALYLIEGNSCGDAFWYTDHGEWPFYKKALVDNGYYKRFRRTYSNLIKEHYREFMAYGGE